MNPHRLSFDPSPLPAVYPHAATTPFAELNQFYRARPISLNHPTPPQVQNASQPPVSAPTSQPQSQPRQPTNTVPVGNQQYNSDQSQPYDSNASAFNNLASVLEQLMLPKSELLSFDGDPRNYHSFITNFRNNIDRRVHDPSAKLNYLIQYCQGKAKKVVADCVIMENPLQGYYHALFLLQQQFGQPYDIARSYIDTLKRGSQIKGDAPSLTELANDMQRCQMTLSQLGYVSDINSTDTLMSVVERLPFHIRTKWAEYAYKITKYAGGEPQFSHLTQFIQERAEVASATYSRKLSGGFKHATTDFKSK